ncbi:MAG: tRNA epoxyqueuosine(34) reductase QueG [Ichthyobacteriaceae bacterium]|nr:tRNA epoxyqueuosine(34) reductase QueG [Ichthyobacteriaceae bacterium]
MNEKEKNTKLIKDEALRLGFSMIGISKAEFLEKDAPDLEKWLKNGFHGNMQYMENNFDKRLDPTLLVPGAKSVISLLYNYYPDKKQLFSDAPKISKYAYGHDYHDIIKKKLRELMNFISEEIGEIDGRVFTDSAPVMERSWASKSGLGWIGNNSLLITNKVGSFQFLSELIIDLNLIADTPATDYCGSCTACIDACPTNAIVSPKVVNGSKCISYLTIELKEEIPIQFKGMFDDWIFGCDACQDVCPWNKFAKPHNELLFQPQGNLMNMSRKDWTEITEEVYREVFKKSPVKRTKFLGLKRNIDFVIE